MGKDDFSYAQYADATARWQPILAQRSQIKLIKTRVKRMNAGFFVSRMGGKPKVITRRKAPFFAVTCQKWCFF
jgi:hypothetical protein